MENKITLYSSRLKSFGFLIISLLAVIGATTLLDDTNKPYIEWFIIFFFSLGSIIFLYRAIKPDSLILSKDGFEVTRTFGKKYFTSWNDVGEFKIVSIRIGYYTAKKMVGYNFVSTYNHEKIGRAISWELSRVEAAFPDNYGKNNKDLIELLNNWKDKNSKQ